MTATLKPDLRVRIGGRKVPASGSNPLVRVVVEMDMNQPAAAALTFGGEPDVALKLGDALEIDLGWTGDVWRVFTGAVVGLEPKHPGIAIRAFGDEAKLLHGGQVSQVFENQTFGEIVKAHAREAGVVTGWIEDGPRVPHAYRHHQSRWDHCKGLAARAGFDLYATEQGKLNFARFARRAGDHVLRMGQDLLALNIRFAQPLPGATVVPESPASSAGDDTAAWLVKDPAPHSATEGEEGVLVVSDALLRTREAAKLAARAIVEASKRATMLGDLKLVGRADIGLGQAVELKDIPRADVNGLYAVRSVHHMLGGNAGFLTLLGIARVAT